jgi:hypothetical protein
MTDDVIPQDIKQFILNSIDSVAQLEGLLMLRSDAGKTWDAKTIAKVLYISEPQATALLAGLSEQGFITAVENASLTYRYEPNSPELKETINRLADVYRQYLVPVTHLIHSKSKMRVQEFANAFRIRKD